MKDRNINIKKYYYKWDNIFFLLSLIFFILWIIGFFYSKFKIESIISNTPAYFSLNILNLISFFIFSIMFIFSMINNNSKYLLITIIAFFFVFITLPFLEPFGRTYDSYKYIGNSVLIIKDNGILSNQKYIPVYFNWPGLLIYTSVFSNVIGLDNFPLSTTIQFIKYFHIITFIIFFLGYYKFAYKILDDKMLALKACLIILLLQTLMTLEYGPNNITYSIIPLTLFSFLKIGSDFKWGIPTTFLLLFIIVSHPFNILFFIAIVLSIWLGFKLFHLLTKTDKVKNNKKVNISQKRIIAILIIILAIFYLIYTTFIGSYLMGSITDFINSIFNKSNNIQTSSGLYVGSNLPELFRRINFSIIFLIASSYVIITIISNRIKNKHFMATPNMFALSISSISLGILVYVFSLFYKYNPTLSLHSRVFNYFVLIGSLLFTYILYYMIMSVIKQKKVNNKKIYKILSIIIILLIIIIPISYFISSYSNEKYFAPTHQTFKVAEFGGNIANTDNILVDNIYPRSVYYNRENLGNIKIIESPGWLSNGIEPDILVLTYMDPYYKEYHNYLDYSDDNYYLKIYATEQSFVFLKR